MTMANPLDQYRDIVRDCPELDRNTAPAIRDARRNAAQLLCSADCAPLPAAGTEGYEYTALDSLFEPDLGLNINRKDFAADIDPAVVFRCGVPNISSLSGVTVNDSFRAGDGLARLLPAGVTVTAFSQADDNAARAINRYYATVARPGNDTPALTLNTALAQDGILIKVDDGVVLDKPIQLVNILQGIAAPDGTPLPLLAIRRILVVIGRHAAAKVLICDHDRATDTTSLTSRVTEVILDDGAALDWYELEESSGHTGRHTETIVRQAADSRLQLFSGTLKCGITRNNFTVHLDGKGAELRIDGMAIADGTRIADNSATVLHHAPHCTSNQTFKYLVSDNARGAFEGLIRVDHGAVGTQAYQNDRNLLGTPGARMHSRPQLEIYCDDVKCSHGAATGQLDERALFYMRARGIDLDVARPMLMNAFMADVIDSVTLSPLRDRLHHLVERRLLGDDPRCEGCIVSPTDNIC